MHTVSTDAAVAHIAQSMAEGVLVILLQQVSSVQVVIEVHVSAVFDHHT
jgi:hypothetical protein